MLIRMAFRNVLRNRRRSAMTLLVIVFGAVALILFGGYKAVTFRNLRESTIRSRLGHLQVYAQGYSKSQAARPLEFGIEDAAATRAEIERNPLVKTTAAQIGLMGLVSNGDKSETFIATAVEPSREKEMNSVRITAGTVLPHDEPDAVVVGKGLATAMNVAPGDYLTLMTTTTSGSLNAVDVRVAGIFTTGVKEFDDRAIRMPLVSAQQLLQTTRVEKILVFLHETEQASRVRRELTEAFASKKWKFEMKDWSELAAFYHQVVALYNGIFGFLGIVVFAIVIFSVANTVFMSIFERTREIGTVMAVGATRGRIWRMFLTEGLIIGVMGGVTGVVAGALLAMAINNGNVMLPPPPGYTAGYRLQILLQPVVVGTAFAIAVVTAAMSSIVPAFKASRMKIVDALGHI